MDNTPDLDPETTRNPMRPSVAVPQPSLSRKGAPVVASKGKPSRKMDRDIITTEKLNRIVELLQKEREVERPIASASPDYTTPQLPVVTSAEGKPPAGSAIPAPAKPPRKKAPSEQVAKEVHISTVEPAVEAALPVENRPERPVRPARHFIPSAPPPKPAKRRPSASVTAAEEDVSYSYKLLKGVLPVEISIRLKEDKALAPGKDISKTQLSEVLKTLNISDSERQAIFTSLETARQRSSYVGK